MSTITHEMQHRIANILLTVLVVIPSSVMGAFAYWHWQNVSSPSTITYSPKIDGPSEVYAGDFVTVKMEVQRNTDCVLDIQRIIEEVDTQRELQLQRVFQTFTKNDGPEPLDYRVQIAPELTAGRYRLFNRVRYLCNPLDYLLPRFSISAVLPITIKERT